MEENNMNVTAGISGNPAAAYDSVKEEMDAVPDTDLVHINVDIPTAMTIVLKTLNGLAALRPEMVKVGNFDLAQFDKLETYALAALQANMVFNVVSRPTESMPELADEATRLRDMLYSDALALVHRDIIRADDLRQIRVANGYKPLASDLGQLAVLLKMNWEQVGSKTAVVAADLERATSLSVRLFNAVAQREAPPTSSLASAALNRQRAYALFFRAYDQARRVVTYLRWKENDADTIAPSLFAGRNSVKRKSDGESAETPNEPVVTTPPVGSLPALPGLPTLAPVAPAASSNSDGAARSPIPVGFPGADPYIRN